MRERLGRGKWFKRFGSRLADGAHALGEEWEASLKLMSFMQLTPDQGDAYRLLPEEMQVLVRMM